MRFLCRNKDVKLVTVEYPLDDSIIRGNTEVKLGHVSSIQNVFDHCQEAKLRSDRSTSVTEV